MIEQHKCSCGAIISSYQVRCYRCNDAKIIADAEKVEPTTPLNVVGTEDYFDCLDEAAEEFAGEWAHPCFSEPLHIDPKRSAAMLAEQASEWMCEEAFEDAYSYVNGEKELAEAFEAALIAFNERQTATSWTPNTKQVFQIPAMLAQRTKGDAA
jgi:hypothetical protein